MRNINLQSGNCVKAPINRKQYSNDRIFSISQLIDFTIVVYSFHSSPSHRVLFREPDVVCYTHAKAMKTGNENGQPTYGNVTERIRDLLANMVRETCVDNLPSSAAIAAPGVVLPCDLGLATLYPAAMLG